MAISLASLQKGISSAPPILCLYGDEGIGKSSFAANAPSPVFIFTENGVGNLDVPRWKVETYEEVMEATSALINEPHNFNTVVYDTLDWFEPMVWKYLIKMNPTTEKGKPINNIEDYGYGSGYKYAIDYWKDFLSLLEELRTKRNMAIIFLGHTTLEKITPPDSDSYQSWSLKLQHSEKTSAKDKIIEYCDAVLFANWRVALTEEDLGFNKTRQRGVGAGERVVHTQKRPTWDAKNRYNLPEQVAIRDPNWGDLWAHLAANIPWFRTFDVQTSLNLENKA